MSVQMGSRIRRLTLAVAMTAAAAAAWASAQTTGVGQRFTATAMDLDRGTALRLEIRVTRWSTEAERQALMKTMMTKGANQLLETLRDRPSAGTLQVDNGLGWDLRFAARVPGEDGGDRVILATDRPISFWETTARPRSIDYPFTVIELHMKDGEGEGTLSLATRVIPNESQNLVVLENFGQQRIRLTEVKASRL